MFSKQEVLQLAAWCKEHSSGDYRKSAEAASALEHLQAENERLTLLCSAAAAKHEDQQIPVAVLNAITHAGLTLVKTQAGYELLRLGQISAQSAETAQVSAMAVQTAQTRQQSMQLAFNSAIDFAIDQGLEAETFLRCWREGDTSEWPEFVQAGAGVDVEGASEGAANTSEEDAKDALRYRWLFNDVDLANIKQAFENNMSPPRNMHCEIVGEIIGNYMEKSTVDHMIDFAMSNPASEDAHQETQEASR